jgi:hypothetical protein
MDRNKTQKIKYGGSPKEDYSPDFEDVRSELRVEKYKLQMQELKKEIKFYESKLPEYQKQIDEKKRIIQKYTGNDTYANKIEFMKQFIKVMETKKQKTEEHIKKKERAIKYILKKMNATDMVIKDDSSIKPVAMVEEPAAKASSHNSSMSSITTVEEDFIPVRVVKPMIRNKPNLTIITTPIEEAEMVMPSRANKLKPVPANLQAMIDQKKQTRKNTESYLRGMVRSAKSLMQPQIQKTRKVAPNK